MLKILTIIFTTVILSACGGGGSSGSSNTGGQTTTTPTTPTTTTDQWLIPTDFVLDGGPGKDGIPSLDYPTMVSRALAEAFLSDNDMVVGIKRGSDIRAYPHKILNWHEVVNDKVDNQYLVFSYCPLTGSSLVWDVADTSSDRTFGVSGLLYNSNLILYDRQTDSMWAQMLSKSVRGERSTELSHNSHVIETTWAHWKAMYPQTQVLSDNTGISRDYDAYPYGSYLTNQTLLFSIEKPDARLHPKSRVVGIKSGNTSKVYPIDALGSALMVINDTVATAKVVVIGSAASRMGVAYSRALADGTELTFSALPDQLPVVMEDQEGNVWNIHGEAVSGLRMGQTLPMLESYTAFWFAWATMFQDPLIYQPSL
ncbi:MAG: hypothetical protein ACI8WB_001974 [Phenylobacterium sp.]|jgi:hypothetical protein